MKYLKGDSVYLYFHCRDINNNYIDVTDVVFRAIQADHTVIASYTQVPQVKLGVYVFVYTVPTDYVDSTIIFEFSGIYNGNTQLNRIELTVDYL